MKTGTELIAEERQRQIEVEGWNQQHDNRYEIGELWKAALCYLDLFLRKPTINGINQAPDRWPWTNKWWKPSPDNRIRELVKAGALIAAEIDRLKATEGKQEGGGQ